MASEITGEQMQAKITAARRDAEGLKDKIKRRKEELADTTRKSAASRSRCCRAQPVGNGVTTCCALSSAATITPSQPSTSEQG